MKRSIVDSARITELLAPFLTADSSRSRKPASLAPSQLECISTYIDILFRWNSRINLTAVRRPEEIVTRHFGESLFAARHLLSPEKPGRSGQPYVIDIGSGAGFPGLPMKLWAPHIRLTLIESNHKKATFLREVIRALKLTDVDVFSSRAEEFLSAPQANAKHRPAAATSGADVVTLRAVEQFDAILPTASDLIAATGKLGLLIGDSQTRRAHQLLPSITWHDPRPIPNSKSRVLLIGYPTDPISGT